MSELSFSFKRDQRMTQKSHFTAVFSNAKRYDSYLLRVYVAPALYDTAAVSFVASRKVGKAVTRNKAKRRLREIYRLIQHDLTDNIDLVMVAKHKTAAVPFSVLKDNIVELLRSKSLMR